MDPRPEDARQILERWLADRGTPAESVVETHTAVVAFAAERAFKMKKSVRLPFVDLTDRAVRLAVCSREVELNRRLAPDVYVSVVDVTDSGGRTVDHAVEMIRLPDDRRLDRLLAAADPAAVEAALGCATGTAARLAQFHLAQPPLPSAAGQRGHDSVERLWRDEIQELGALLGPDAALAQESAQLALNYVDGRAELFDARESDGWIREGHGDLRADSVFCLEWGPTLIDCLEFSDRLRCGDILADVAFLAMDLERLGYPEAATRFLDAHRELTGDDWPPSLAHHWIAYRAHVRAKVDLLQPAADVAAHDRSRQHLALALEHLRSAQVKLIVVGGLPGTGKTTLSSEIADQLPARLLSSDAVRVELFGRGQGVAEPYGRGRYSPEGRNAVYDELLHRAEALLSNGHHVVADASWSDPQQRDRVAGLARRTHSPLTVLECRVDTATARERLRRRLRAGTDLSDADAEIATRMASDWVAWPGAHVIDTDRVAPGEVVSELLTQSAAPHLRPPHRSATRRRPEAP